MTAARPMLRSPSVRVGEDSALAGGAMTEGWGAPKAANERETRISDGGATTCAGKVRAVRRLGCVASGGGGTTALVIRGLMRVISAAGVTGTSGIASRGFWRTSDQATMLGSETSVFSLTLGWRDDGLRSIVGFTWY